ncbi:MAG TPA: autotransporter domain-containing protein [Usitatibacteraceae bacterium]|nr:autotransporter domain-containing protein [Usitatibacteraceae bacterium]
MKPVRRVLPALLLTVFAGATVPAANAAQFSNVVVFGDSLSDAGFYRPFLASLGLPAPLVATLGRFTTNPGPIWAELISQHYGATPAASNANGWIFAQGGARVASDSSSTPPGGAQRPVSTQVTEYLARNGGAADPGALHTIWAGANDFFQNFGAFAVGAINQTQLQANVLGAATAEIQQVGRLYAAGARYVMVFSLPNIGATPQFASLGPAAAGAATALSAGYNTTLFTGLASTGMRVIPVDTFALLSEIMANPGAYGFSNTTGIACGAFPPITTPTTVSSQFCYTGNLVASGADNSYVFADGVHPTTGAHRIVADFVKSLIDGPTAYSMLGEVPLRTRAGHIQTLSDGLALGQASPGRFNAFASMAGGNFEVESRGNDASFDSNNRSYSVGITMRANESIVVGAAIGKSKSQGHFGDDLGGFRTSEDTGSIFFGARAGGFYASGAASIANIDFTQSSRVIKLGSARRVAESAPSGSNASAFVNAGYDFAVGKLSVGPTVAWTSQNIDVNAFDESGAGSANLHIGAQKRRSEVASVGIRASYDLGTITPYAKYTADKERRNDDRLITASPLTFAAGNSYDLPAFQPADSSWGTVTVGIRGRMSDSIAYGINYAKVTGRSGVNEDFVFGTLAIRF